MNADAIHSTNAEVKFRATHQADDSIGNNTAFVFGPFTAIPESRTLICDGAPVELGGRAFDLLMTLLVSRGQIVSRDAIMRQVWPTTTVDESNVRFQMTCLRRALGAERDRIKTVPGRGYIFIADDPMTLDTGGARLVAPLVAEQAPIVIIDGSPENRELLFRVLASAGVRVESFASVAAFLSRDLGQGSRRSLRIAGLAA